MLYVITDILLKLALNTSKDGDHAMRNSLFVFNVTFNNVSAIIYSMVTIFIDV
jgi:hypothetical protein